MAHNQPFAPYGQPTGDWITYYTQDGSNRPYYFNPKTNTTQWEPPAELQQQFAPPPQTPPQEQQTVYQPQQFYQQPYPQPQPAQQQPQPEFHFPPPDPQPQQFTQYAQPQYAYQPPAQVIYAAPTPAPITTVFVPPLPPKSSTSSHPEFSEPVTFVERTTSTTTVPETPKRKVSLLVIRGLIPHTERNSPKAMLHWKIEGMDYHTPASDRTERPTWNHMIPLNNVSETATAISFSVKVTHKHPGFFSDKIEYLAKATGTLSISNPNEVCIKLSRDKHGDVTMKQRFLSKEGICIWVKVVVN